MEPEIQKFAAVALVGLMAFFPVFNQVKETSLEALTDADHQAKWKSFFKNWDDIPEDEKLEYWDGRNKPPGADGDFDRDRIDDDAKFKNPDQQPADGDRDGDGVPDDQDADPDDPDVQEPPQYHWETEELWSFTGGGQAATDEPQAIGTAGRFYDYVNVTWSYENFAGQAEFTLEVGGAQAWRETMGANDLSRISPQDSDDASIENVGTQAMTIAYDYSPFFAPNDFQVTITGAYRVYEDTQTEAEPA